MNLDKFEKIDGREALKRLADGQDIFSEFGSRYYLREDSNFLWLQTPNSAGTAGVSLTEFLMGDWYIPKPFDVRQAMLDRPNEWVAAYKAGAGKWFKVGFNTDAMKAVIEEIECDAKPFWEYDSVRPGILRDCIPIEDVPEEATR